MAEYYLTETHKTIALAFYRTLCNTTLIEHQAQWEEDVHEVADAFDALDPGTFDYNHFMDICNDGEKVELNTTGEE